MNINRYYKDFNIIPITKMNVRERVEFANSASLFLLDSFPKLDLDYIKMLDVLQKTEMYIARIPENIAPANYSYKDEIIYISDETDINLENEFIWHEIIHRIQHCKNKRGNLTQMGLCLVLETKIQGLALNEAAIQYVVEKLLNTEIQIIEIYGMKIPTTSKNYYPILTNLISQIAFLLGDYLLIESVLKSNENFKYNTIDNLGLDVYYEIQSNFDKILECKDNITKANEDNKIQENINKIKILYLETQNLIMNSYFSNLIKRIDTMQELEKFKIKLLNYKNYVGANEGLVSYWKLYEEMQPKIKQIETKIKNRSLVVVSDNIIARIFRKIKKYLSAFLVQN